MKLHLGVRAAALTLAVALCGGLAGCRACVLPEPPALPAQSMGSTAEGDQILLDTLLAGVDTSDLDDSAPLVPGLLASIAGDGYTLAAASIRDGHSRYSLVLGAVDGQTGQLLGPVFEARAYGGQPHCAAIRRYDGAPTLLYTCNGQSQGYSWGTAGQVSFDGETLTWAWPVEGDLRDQETQAYADYNDYWAEHLALLVPGGLEIFTQNSDYGPYEGSPVQWKPDSYVPVYSTPEDDLPPGVLWQTRLWLEEFTRNDHNPWQAGNTSALWRILSLTEESARYPGQKDTERAYSLIASAEGADGLLLSAAILFDGEGGTVSRVIDFFQGGDLGDDPAAWVAQNITQRNLLITNYLQAQYGCRAYLAENAAGAPEEGDCRVDKITYLGERILYETDGVAVQVDKSWYSTRNGALDWQPASSSIVVLARSGDGAFQEVLGEAGFNTDGMDTGDVILQVAYGLLDLDVCLYRDGYPTPVGPGNWAELFNSAEDGEPAVEILEGWEPIYGEGDYWDRWTAEGFSALRYCTAAEGRFSVNTVDVTRGDLYTPKGIRVGSSRAEVLAAYPSALTGNYWDAYPDQPDMLSYLPWSDHDPAQISDFSQLEDLSLSGFGPAILFFFEGDKVSQITLTNMVY